MSKILLLSIIIVIIVVILGVVLLFIIWGRGKERNYIEPDYRIFFILGICFFPMELIFSVIINTGFIGITAMGIIYFVIGLAHRDKWKNN